MKKKTKTITRVTKKFSPSPPLNEPIVFIEVHVSGNPVYINVDEIQRFQPYGDTTPPRTLITFVDGSTLIIDESPQVFMDALQKVIIIRTHSR